MLSRSLFRFARAARVPAARLGARQLASAAAAAESTASAALPTDTELTMRGHGVKQKIVSPDVPVSSAIIVLGDRPGALEEVLQSFKEHKVNLTHISSRPSKGSNYNYDIAVDFEGTTKDARVQQLLLSVREFCLDLILLDPQEVPWFPRRIQDLDQFSVKTLDAGAELEADHPGFKDAEYRERRSMIVENARKYRHGDSIPNVQYSDAETATWGAVFDKLTALYPLYACKQFNYIFPLLEKNCGYRRDNIPQAQDISDFLKECTGFQLRPVGGLLSARDFLNALAFRVFFSTQYIRHHSKPLYTPEPDICHELMGHAPMFADPQFADFSHEIGLASLGASDADIKRLATCYWYSVEFGLCRQNGALKAYGAGLLSSFGEIEYACSPTRPAGGTDKLPEYRPWDPFEAADQPYPITTYQPTYYVANSLEDATKRMRAFCASLTRPFHARYLPYSQSVRVDRAVRMVKPMLAEASSAQQPPQPTVQARPAAQ